MKKFIVLTIVVALSSTIAYGFLQDVGEAVGDVTAGAGAAAGDIIAGTGEAAGDIVYGVTPRGYYRDGYYRDGYRTNPAGYYPEEYRWEPDMVVEPDYVDIE